MDPLAQLASPQHYKWQSPQFSSTTWDPTPQPNSSPAVFEGEGMANQMLAAAAYNNDIELILELNETIAEAKALKPTSLAEAKWCPGWLQWEQGI